MISRRGLFLVVFIAVWTSSAAMCCLCPYGQFAGANCFSHGEKADRWVGVNYSCNDASVDASGLSDNQCPAQQSAYQQKCCTSPDVFDFPDVAQPEPTAPPGLVTQEGNHPVCNICFNEQFPGKPYTITSVQYVAGNPTCSDLYYLGKTKNIEGSICYPLQLYMQEPCGCNIPPPPTSPNGPNPQPTLPPTAQPTKAPVYTGIPPRMERIVDEDKDSLKLSNGRKRGSANSYRDLRDTGLRGQSSEENPIHPLLQSIGNTR
eukprot:CAMPEP_0198156214 /NCGR_PEP_ID=MMETSP1443-20131203/69540_1 /TAXON_ID=186043 /ORGANISM="Entomoneis sp., Strain CCMP2396" /LENGTH=260 /DNA_ID=CAMNT_0043822999 /DNA_START=95 /DNA_END=877 /DNA_ORIENTATION=-